MSLGRGLWVLCAYGSLLALVWTLNRGGRGTTAQWSSDVCAQSGGRCGKQTKTRGKQTKPDWPQPSGQRQGPEWSRENASFDSASMEVSDLILLASCSKHR